MAQRRTPEAFKQKSIHPLTKKRGGLQVLTIKLLQGEAPPLLHNLFHHISSDLVSFSWNLFEILSTHAPRSLI